MIIPSFRASKYEYEPYIKRLNVMLCVANGVPVGQQEKSELFTANTLVQEGYLSKPTDDDYILTDTGKEWIEQWRKEMKQTSETLRKMLEQEPMKIN